MYDFTSLTNGCKPWHAHPDAPLLARALGSGDGREQEAGSSNSSDEYCAGWVKQNLPWPRLVHARWDTLFAAAVEGSRDDVRHL